MFAIEPANVKLAKIPLLDDNESTHLVMAVVMKN
jgi:hypothetical protein